MATGVYCEHGRLRRTCAACKEDAVAAAQARAAANRARGESRSQEGMQTPTLHYPWQKDAYQAWVQGGRAGLVALSPGLPMGDLPYAVMADLVNASRSTNVLLACAVGEGDAIADALRDRFHLAPTRLIDHHFLEPREDGTLVVADMDELRTVDLSKWGRFASTGLLVLLDADAVRPDFGQLLLQTPFPARFCLSRQPSAVDALVSRPWSPAFGPLLYRHTEAQARDLGVLPRIHYRLHVEMLRPSGKDTGPEGPWDPSDIPASLAATDPSPFIRGRARDAAIARAEEDADVLIIHDGAPIRQAARTVDMQELPTEYDPPPGAWMLADPSLGARDVLRVATVAWKTLGGPGRIEDTIVAPVPADLCRIAPWDVAWQQAARQLDRVAIALLLAEDPAAALAPEELEALVGVGLALRGIPAEQLHELTAVVERAADAAQSGKPVAPDEVRAAGKSFGGLAAALLVAAEGGADALVRLSHPGFTPTVPDLPHPSLYDARRHAWRGRAFQALAQAAKGGDLVTAWGRYPELRFVFPSSLLLEAATAYCKRHRLKGPLDELEIQPIRDRPKVAKGKPAKAMEVLQEWEHALGVAEEHEREFLAKMHARQPERERRREGMALPDLLVQDKDRDTVTLRTRQARFPATNISPGSEVALVPRGERDELGRGLVSRISSRTVTVEFPAGAPYRLPTHVTVNLTFDAKVFEAYHTADAGAIKAMGAAKGADTGPDGLVQAALLGELKATRPKKQSLPVDTLTDSQREAVEAVLSGGRAHLIHGPPGTGKTHTLVHLAMALTRAGHSVLVTADSNAAVDNLAVGLRRNGAPVVRVGHAPNIRDPAALACRVDPLDAPRFVRWAAEQGIVVACTNYGAFRYLDARGSLSSFNVDYVIHDEAGQSTAPSSLAALMRGKRMVLAGDPLQLPPTVVSMDAKDAGLDVTLFERIEELTGDKRTKMLRTQFRMRDEIVGYSNERYYEGKIETHPSAAEQETLPDLPVRAFLHVTGKENPRQKNGSISNDWEVEAVAFMVDELRAEARERGWTMAILTPYQAQRERLRRRLRDIEVSTVDGAQGREWDIVLYSSVRSNPQHRLGFLSDERRLNVAVTRARRNFILVGDERTLRDHEGFSLLIDGAEKIRRRYPHPLGPAARGPGVPKGKGKARGRRRGSRGPRSGPSPGSPDPEDKAPRGQGDGPDTKPRGRGRRRSAGAADGEQGAGEGRTRRPDKRPPARRRDEDQD